MTQDLNHSLNEMISKQIIPRDALEKRIVNDPLWREGCNWGIPRKGHPEGAVIYHIAEVLQNVALLEKELSPELIRSLRLITLFHDTYKYLVDPMAPKRGDNHHARIARKCAASFPLEERELMVIETHDDAYHIWNAVNNGMAAEKVQSRLDHLFLLNEPHLSLYYYFYCCDNRTGNKDQRPLAWFESMLPESIEKIDLIVS